MICSIPNLLSCFRLLSVPFLILFAVFDQQAFFLALFILALLSDALDGYFARRLKQTSKLGGKLDSWGDLAIYATIPFCIWHLWPETVERELPYVIIAFMSFLLPVLTGFLKFKKLTSYHTWGAKVSGILLGISLPLLLISGLSWPFRFSVIILLFAEIEEIFITLSLDSYKSEIPSFWHIHRKKTVPHGSEDAPNGN